MNFNDVKGSAELVLLANQVPLLVGETGIGKTSLARAIAEQQGWELVVIDGNLLKEGEIGGLPTVQEVEIIGKDGKAKKQSTTVYAVHHTLHTLDQYAQAGKTVLLFIDEINRCEHSVQQELMNLILNREINGYALPDSVRIMAAMNPENEFDYQTVDMDSAQKNRFVWLTMEADYMQWLDWAMGAGIEQKVIEFISTYPEYLYQHEEGGIDATPRSYERVSQLYAVYKHQEDTFTKTMFQAAVKGNVGELIANAFMAFLERNDAPLLSYEEVFDSTVTLEKLGEKVSGEAPTRLYVAVRHIVNRLEREVPTFTDEVKATMVARFVEFLKLCPLDLMVASMKDMAQNSPCLYQALMDNVDFVNAYFEAIV